MNLSFIKKYLIDFKNDGIRLLVFLRNLPDSLNTLFERWLPLITVVGIFITVIGIFLPVWITLGIYWHDLTVKNSLTGLAFDANSCFNLRVANIHTTAKDGEMYQLMASYDTNLIRNSFSDLYINIKNRGKDPNLLFQILEIMDRYNILLANHSYLPSNQLAVGGGQVEEIYKSLGYRYDNFECTIP